jgi:hypothetical protein
MDFDNETRTQRLISGYQEWLSTYHWNWFGTLTFRGYPSIAKAVRLFNRWITEIEKTYGTKNFRWFRITERGSDGQNGHFHVLIGGLHLLPACRFKAMFRWQELAGEAQIASFMAHQKGIFYILKTIRPGKDPEIAFRLGPIHTVRP